MIHLVDIDPGTWRLKLEVAESQKHYVANSAVMLARAYAYRNQRSRAFVIYDDETPVGMGLYYDLPDLECYDLSQIFIDERYQGRGHGRAATKLILEAMKQDGKYSKVDLLPSVEQLAIFHNKDVAFVTENEDGVVTVYAIGDKPTSDYTMQVSITEVVA